MAALGVRRTLPTILNLLNSENRSQIVVALNQLASNGNANHLAHVLRFTGSKDRMVQDAACRAFKNISQFLDVGEIMEVIGDALASENQRGVLGGFKMLQETATDNPGFFSMVTAKLVDENSVIVWKCPSHISHTESDKKH